MLAVRFGEMDKRCYYKLLNLPYHAMAGLVGDLWFRNIRLHVKV